VGWGTGKRRQPGTPIKAADTKSLFVEAKGKDGELVVPGIMLYNPTTGEVMQPGLQRSVSRVERLERQTNMRLRSKKDVKDVQDVIVLDHSDHSDQDEEEDNGDNASD
jgi:hypothetical protein